MLSNFECLPLATARQNPKVSQESSPEAQLHRQQSLAKLNEQVEAKVGSPVCWLIVRWHRGGLDGTPIGRSFPALTLLLQRYVCDSIWHPVSDFFSTIRSACYIETGLSHFLVEQIVVLTVALIASSSLQS